MATQRRYKERKKGTKQALKRKNKDSPKCALTHNVSAFYNFEYVPNLGLHFKRCGSDLSSQVHFYITKDASHVL